jgi:hypothetical protein
LIVSVPSAEDEASDDHAHQIDTTWRFLKREAPLQLAGRPAAE